MKKNNFILKNSKSMQIKSRILVVGFIFSITTFLILSDASKIYKSEMAFLIVPKNEIFAQQTEHVVENISQFPKLLSFYDSLIKFNPQLKDEFLGEKSSERKKLWNKKIETSRSANGKGTILTMSILSKNKTDAEIISKKSSENLFRMASSFYNIKKDLDIRLIEGPIISITFKNLPWIIFISVVIGMVTSLALNLFLDFLEKVVFSKKINLPLSPLSNLKNKFKQKKPIITETEKDGTDLNCYNIPYDSPYEFKELEEDKIQIKNNLEEEFAQEDNSKPFNASNYPNFPEIPKSYTKEASAPDNLPIAEIPNIFELPKNKESAEEKPVPGSEEKSNSIAMKMHEPTKEELKERLNKLLRGDI